MRIITSRGMDQNSFGSLNNEYNEIILIGKINSIIRELSNHSVFPTLDDHKLIDILEKDKGKIYNFIKDSSILSHLEDILLILEAKYLSVKDHDVQEKELLQIYEVIFGEKSMFNKKIIIFSGGTGSNSLTKGLIGVKGDLTLLINAYDDGKSTGDLRRKFNILGPSDITKNVLALIGDSKEELRNFLNYRFSRTETQDKLKGDLKEAAVVDGKLNKLNDLLNKVRPDIRLQLKNFLEQFYQELLNWEKKTSKIYDLRDYGIRNIIYVGAYLYYKKDYHYINNKLIELFGLQGKIILNSQQPLWLIAITEDGNLLNSESAIVNDNLAKEITEIFLIKRVLNDEEIKQFYSFSSIEDKIDYINANFAIYPQATNEAIEAITQAELIIFAPTTFYSSLIPTLITKGISKALNKSNALKISVANLIRERGYHTVGENLVEMEKYVNHGINERSFTEIDYLIINTHGNRTDGVMSTNRLPVDKKLIFQYGVELVEVKVEDVNEGNKHQHKLITQIINSLKSIDDLGYRINRGKLVRREEINIIENKREQLRQLLSNPFLYKIKAKRVERLVTEILGIDKIEDFKPIRPIKVIILGAGRSTRLKSDIPKIIYPISGKANLAYLLKRYSLIDDKPFVVINDYDKPKLKEWFKSNSEYNAKLIVTRDIRGTAMTLLGVMKKELRDFDGDIFLSWGDITNIRLETIQLTFALHQAMMDPVMTLPTAWGRNPYAGITRDGEGKVNGIFLTREYPEQKRKVGERDSGTFIFKLKEVREALTQLVNISDIEKGKIDELNFLEVIPLLTSKGKEIIGVANVDFRECMGFNTQEEARLVERYMGELKEMKLLKENMIDMVEEEIIREHSNRLEEYLDKTYKGILLDIDETITNEEDGNIPEDIIKILIGLANKGIPIGIVTGRTNDSLTSKFISKIFSHSSFMESSKDKIYMYPENGAYCYRLDQGFGTKMYGKKIPYYVSETAIKFLRKNVLGFKDDYAVRDYKLHIFPQNSTDQKQYVNKINSMFKKMDIPLVAYRSSPIEKSGSILVSNLGTNKGVALSHFAKINNISIDEVVKVGDMADIDSVDHSLLKGKGGFSVSEIDIYNRDQVGIPIVKGPLYKGVNGSRWLFNNLKFSITNLLKS